MGRIEEKLKSLNIQLGEAKPPVGNYIGCKIVGNLLYASGRVSDLKGKVGSDVNTEEAKKAAHETVLLILAIIKNEIKDLDVYILPHPLLGKVTLREMLYFTIHHNEHHLELLQNRS